MECIVQTSNRSRGEGFASSRRGLRMDHVRSRELIEFRYPSRPPFHSGRPIAVFEKFEIRLF